MMQVTDSDHPNTTPGAGAPAALHRGLPDIQTMRAAATALLGPEGPLPRFDELADLTEQLRRQLRELGPAVECALEALPEGCDRAQAQLAAAAARALLAGSPGPGLVSATEYARSLARELRAMCNLYEALTTAAGAQS